MDRSFERGSLGGGAVSFSILIVDDEPNLPELFRQHFRRETRDGRYLLHFETSGDDGLRRIAELGPELVVILSDINMPGIDGLELLRRTKELRPELPVLIVTAYADDGRQRRAAELGAAAFLAKPIDFAALKRRLAELVRGAAGG
jgi:CheY-like chemotaxis protein